MKKEKKIKKIETDPLARLAKLQKIKARIERKIKAVSEELNNWPLAQQIVPGLSYPDFARIGVRNLTFTNNYDYAAPQEYFCSIDGEFKLTFDCTVKKPTYSDSESSESGSGSGSEEELHIQLKGSYMFNQTYDTRCYPDEEKHLDLTVNGSDWCSDWHDEGDWIGIDDTPEIPLLKAIFQEYGANGDWEKLMKLQIN